MGLDIHAAALGGWVPAFVRLSNRLAGITREPTAAEISAHRGLLAANSLRVENLELFIKHVAPGAGLRDRRGPRADATSSQTTLREDLTTLVVAARTKSASPARLHKIYRNLRPFTDGNGRCARALWMWQMMRRPSELAAIAGLDLGDAEHPLNSDAISRRKLM
jgi:hypothetical protein